MLVTCCQRHHESTHLLDILFMRCWLLTTKDIRNQHINQVSCLDAVGYLLAKTSGTNTSIRYPVYAMLVYLLPKTSGINTSIRYPVQRMLFTCCQRHHESTHLLDILFRRCWLLAAKDIRNQHIYQVSCLEDVVYLQPKTKGINTSIRYSVQSMLFTCSQRHKESTHLLGIMFRRCWCTCCQRHQESTHLLRFLFRRCWCTCCQRHKESTLLLGILFRGCCLLAAKDIRNQHFYQVSCLEDVGDLLPKI